MADKKDESASTQVIAPGGPRPADQVHGIGPGQAVQRNPDGTYAVVMKATSSYDERRPAVPERMVLTPGGFRPASKVNHVKPHHALQHDAERIRSVAPTGTVVRAIGEIHNT